MYNNIFLQKYLAYCKLYINFAAEFKNEFTMFNLKFKIMKRLFMKLEDYDKKSYKEMLIYEMNRSEKLENEIRNYKKRVKSLEEYVKYLESRIYLY